MAIALILVVCVAATWVIAQPLRSSDAYSAAVTAAIHGDARVALTDARTAASENPTSVDPLFLLSQIYSGLGNGAAARQKLVQAASRQPSNPATWQELGCYDYARHGAQTGTEFRRLLQLQPADAMSPGFPTTFCAGVPG